MAQQGETVGIKDKFFFTFACAFLAGMMWFMAEALGGWTILTQIMEMMALMAVVVGACMLAIIGTIYFLTVFRAHYYAKRLREAGYTVHLHSHEVWGFAIMTLVALFFIPMAIWMTQRVYAVYLCVLAGECYKEEEWYYMAPIVVGMIWLVGLIGLGSVIKIWWQSFRPLREHHKKMRLGQEVDLPRLR